MNVFFEYIQEAQIAVRPKDLIEGLGNKEEAVLRSGSPRNDWPFVEQCAATF